MEFWIVYCVVVILGKLLDWVVMILGKQFKQNR